MAEVDAGKSPTLSEQYLLKVNEEKLDVGTKAAEETQVENTVSAPSGEVISQKTEETPVVAEESSKAFDTAAGDSEEAPDASAGAGASAGEATSDAAEESSKSAEQESSGGEEVEETPEIKIETAPADFRFPTTNQTRHCFTRYVEYHRCIAAKGEGASDCDKFAKYYRALCPGEWVDRWNEQRENGTFPGPL